MQKLMCCVVLLLGLSPALAAADSTSQSQTLWHPQSSLLLAATSSNSAMEGEAAPEMKYKRRFITANTVHKYLGLGSLLSATLAVLSPKEDDGPHHDFAEAAAYLGAGAVATGIGFHFNDLRLSDGVGDPDNLHAILGTVGTLGYFGALEDAPDSEHATYGSVGIASMAVAIKLTW